MGVRRANAGKITHADRTYLSGRKRGGNEHMRQARRTEKAQKQRTELLSQCTNIPTQSVQAHKAHLSEIQTYRVQIAAFPLNILVVNLVHAHAPSSVSPPLLFFAPAACRNSPSMCVLANPPEAQPSFYKRARSQAKKLYKRLLIFFSVS